MNTPDFIVLHDDDTVATALRDVEAATAVQLAGPRGPLPERTLPASIRLGHKIALQPIAEGALIIKHGHPIGRATAPIAVGEHVHVQNVVSLSRVTGDG